MQDYLGYLKIARTLANKQSLAIKFERSANAMPRTDGKTLYLPLPDPLWNADEWAMWNDTAWHEIGHNMPVHRDVFSVVEEARVDMRSLFGAVLNVIDDYRVDRNRCQEYLGMREASDKVTPQHITKNSELDVDMSTPGMRELSTVMAFDAYCRGLVNPAVQGLYALLTAKLDALGLAWFEHLRRDYVDRYMAHETGIEELDTARSIFRDVFKQDPQASGDGGAPKKGKYNASKPGEGDEDSDSSSTGEGDEGAKDADSEADGGVVSVVSYEALLRHPHAKRDKPDGKAVRILYDEFTEGRDYIPHTDASNRIVNVYNGDWPYDTSPPPVTAHRVKHAVDTLNVDSIVGHARRLLQTETRKKFTYNQKQGKLDISKIHRVVVPQSSASERLFKQKFESKSLDTAVSVLVDFSYSMHSGTKLVSAMSSAVALSRLFTTLRIPFEILGFTEHTDKNITYVFKPFGSTVTESTLIDALCKASNLMSNNCDGDSIIVAHSRLMQQNQARKVLLVLSDGSPCGGVGDIDGFTHKVIQSIESSGRCDIIGLGIEDHNVKRLYKTHTVVRNAAELPAKLIDTLENILLERKIK